MKIFGIEINSADAVDDLREAVRELERQLEDVGWMKLNQDAGDSHLAVKESYQNMVKRSRFAWVTNPLVGQAIGLTTSYVFGGGVMEPRSDDEEVQKIISEFWNDRDNKISFTSPKIQIELSDKLQYDGEIALILQVDLDGSVYVRIMDPLTISDIVTDSLDKQRPLFYKKLVNGDAQYIPDYTNGLALIRDDRVAEWNALLLKYNILPGQVVKDTYIFHLKVNADPLDKRGIPFVYRAIAWANANAKINSDAATFINAQAQFAWKKKVSGTQTQIDAMKARQNQNTRLTNPSYQAGSTYYGNTKIDMEAVGLPATSGTLFETGIRRTLLMVCAAFGIMEHYFGDPSTGNLATATAMELPMLKKFMALQTLWAGIQNDILQFQLDMKALALNKKSFHYNPIKNRISLNKARDYKSRMIDIDFPPILEKDLKNLSEAMSVGKNEGLIPIDTARRIYMQGVGINNIDEEMQKEFAEKPDPIAGAFGNPGKPNMNESRRIFKYRNGVRVYENVNSVPNDLAKDRAKALKLADANKQILRKLKGYLGEISEAYNGLVRETKNDLKVLPAVGGYVIHFEKATENLNRFFEAMKSAAVHYYPQAVMIGESYVKSHVKIKESKIFEADMDRFIESQINWNSEFLKASLLPAIKEKMDLLKKKKFVSESELLDAVSESFQTMESRVGKYASAFWTVAQRSVKEAAKDSGVKAWFIGVEDQDNCDGCSEAIAGNPYPVDQVPVPGDQDCLTNCRHAIQLQGDESLEESDIALLKDAEIESKNGYRILDPKILEGAAVHET